MFCSHVCVHSMRKPDACRGWKRESDPLELEFWMVKNRNMSAGNQARFFGHEENVLNHWAISLPHLSHWFLWNLTIDDGHVLGLRTAQILVCSYLSLTCFSLLISSKTMLIVETLFFKPLCRHFSLFHIKYSIMSIFLQSYLFIFFTLLINFLYHVFYPRTLGIKVNNLSNKLHHRCPSRQC